MNAGNLNSDQSHPPYSEDAEKGVLCSLLLAPGKVAKLCSERLWPGAFYVLAHQILYDTILEWNKPDQKVDFVWLCEALKDQLAECGGKETVCGLYTFVPTPINAEYYINIMLEKYQLRRAILFSNKLSERCKEEQDEIRDQFPEWEREFSEIAHLNNGVSPFTGRTVLEWIPESLVELSRCKIDRSQILLGDRWLERGQGAFLVGPSGIGKSVALIQWALMIGAGRVAFGIPVSGTLKVLILQSEDSRNDRIEMAQMLPALGLSEAQQEMVHHNVRIVSVRGVAGKDFLRQLDHTLRSYECEDWRTDIVAINPLTAYLGGDETKPEVCTAFLRVGLDPILTRYNCAALIAHHPPKTSQNPTDKFRYFDWQYRMAGSHHLTNWARATVGIEPTDGEGVFRFIAGKRGEKIGWEGREMYLAHSQQKGQLLWVPASSAQIAQAQSSSPKSVDLESVLELVPVLDPKLTETLLNEIKGKFSVGRDKAQSALRELEADGRIFNRSIPNPTAGRRSFRGYSKTPES